MAGGIVTRPIWLKGGEAHPSRNEKRLPKLNIARAVLCVKCHQPFESTAVRVGKDQYQHQGGC